ncbi:MAG: RsmB/NOP family class I SAM-dependent RNA methyltransferase [Deltaproteobacteria bacterium]|nr:RsmB/NOP family class I SAM-dependent RNA methyltransferase [Deltaproteobacteria bacterium]
MDDPEYMAFASWLRAGEVPPSLDRFVAGYIREQGWVREPARAAAVVRFLDDAVAWGTLAALAEQARGKLPSALQAFCAAHRRPRELLQSWRAAGPEFAARVRGWASGADPLDLRAGLDEIARLHDDEELRLWARMVRGGVPPWHAPCVQARAVASGEGWVHRWIDRQCSRPPTWVRVSEPRKLPTVRGLLEGEGLVATERVGAALAVRGDTPVMRTRAWKEGRVEIQDLASQLVGESVPVRPGEHAWDACAGTGGKTLQLWSRMEGRGTIHATDAAPPRLVELRKRLKRAGAHNVRVAFWDGRVTPPLPPDVASRGGYDAVLVDAPCSGSGTFRRRPDARLRTQPSANRKWARQQVDLLDAASRSARSGGSVTYATCSPWVEEDEAVVSAFLARRKEWTLSRQALVGAPDQDADTLFVAVLRRQR